MEGTKPDDRLDPTADAAPAEFEALWPRLFALDDLRSLLGPDADEMLRVLLGRRLNEPVWNLVDRGGKRWRPVVSRLSFMATGGREPVPEEAFQAVELLHVGSLIIDDIEDAAAERRGGPPVHLVHGLPIALNAANAAYFRALGVLGVALPDETRLRAVDMLGRELFTAHLGQAMDLSLGAFVRAGAPVGSTHYRIVARAKTGALVRIAARLGAIAAGAAPALEETLSAWASDLGLAYQIRDDVDDLGWRMGDLRASRLTHPLLLVLEESDPETVGWLRGLFGVRGTAEADVQKLDALLDATGAVERSRAAAREAARSAVSHLDALPASPHRDALARLTETLVGG
jgi:geranylgeranyl diphosphate synthase type I